ncbi:MAG: DUF4825 domain-containing protein [Paenisporosarcina sp.]|uniref:DUF4825 domain-containing protein n=1 Tax=Paenisporosarcina sp. TaxID=1932001 RepID=UPI003C76A86F
MTNNENRLIDEKLTSLPKPTMSNQSKQAIHSILLEELSTVSPSKKRRELNKYLFTNLAGIAVFALLAFFIFNSIQENNNFSPAKQSSSDGDVFSINGIPYKLENHIKYKGSYIGDNSSVIAILDGLPGAAYRRTIELQTKKQPYGLIVNYGRNDEEKLNTSEYDEYWTDKRSILLYNATVLFMVIDNLDSVDFHLGLDDNKVNHFQFTRAEIETLYGRDMAHYVDNFESWNQEVLTVIKSDTAVTEFYSTQQ